MLKILTCSFIGAAMLWCGGFAIAQTSPEPTRSADVIELITEPAAQPAKPAAPTVRIHKQDAGSSIEELRVGSQTQEINVKPAGRAPAYQVRPNNNNTMRSRSGAHSSDGTNGPRVWNVIKF